MGEMFGEKLGGLEIGGGCKVSAGAIHCAQSAQNLHSEMSPRCDKFSRAKQINMVS